MMTKCQRKCVVLTAVSQTSNKLLYGLYTGGIYIKKESDPENGISIEYFNFCKISAKKDKHSKTLVSATI